MAFRLGPQTGAGDGNREYKAATNLRGLDTGARANDEEKKRKARDKLARRAAKQARKKGWG